MKRLLLVSCGLAVAGFLAAPAEAGRIVIANDEWTLGDSAGAPAPPNDLGTFATNVAAWFTGGGAGTFHAYSDNFGLTGGALAAAMTGAGHGWTTGTAGFTFDLATLSGYDGIFLAANAASNSVLIDYVNAGGNVYIAGGTGCCGGAGPEAAQWNSFLKHFGLAFGSPYNNIAGNLAISSPHPIFVGVDSLYQNNGNSVFDLDPGDPQNQVLVSSGGHGLYAVYDPVPEPGTMLLMSIGLGALGVRRRFRRL